MMSYFEIPIRYVGQKYFDWNIVLLKRWQQMSLSKLYLMIKKKIN
mgnify:CR=1 FL=1